MCTLEARTKVLAMSTSLEIVVQKKQANLKEVRLKRASGDRQEFSITGARGWLR